MDLRDCVPGSFILFNGTFYVIKRQEYEEGAVLSKKAETGRKRHKSIA